MKIQGKLYGVLCLLLALAFASVAQTAATPAPTTLSPEERAAALKSLQATHDAFLQSIAGLSEKQWKFKPAPDRWSVAEVSEHIAVSESLIFGMIQSKIMTSPADPAKRAEVAGKDEIILTKVPDRSRKAQAPEFLKPTDRWATQAELTKAFEDSRKGFRQFPPALPSGRWASGTRVPVFAAAVRNLGQDDLVFPRNLGALGRISRRGHDFV